MPSEMVERCRTAIARELDKEDLSPFARLDNAARAVLEALREPTAEMGMAAFDATRDIGDETPLAEEYLAVWQAMIDEALKPCA